MVTRELTNQTAQPPARSTRMARAQPGRRKPSSLRARREWEKSAGTSGLPSQQRDQTVRETRWPADVVVAAVELAVGDLVAPRPQDVSQVAVGNELARAALRGRAAFQKPDVEIE